MRCFGCVRRDQAVSTPNAAATAIVIKNVRMSYPEIMLFFWYERQAVHATGLNILDNGIKHTTD